MKIHIWYKFILWHNAGIEAWSQNDTCTDALATIRPTSHSKKKLKYLAKDTYRTISRNTLQNGKDIRKSNGNTQIE